MSDFIGISRDRDFGGQQWLGLNEYI